MKPTNLSRLIAQQGQRQAAPEEIRDLTDLDLSDDEIRAVMDMADDEDAEQEAALAVAEAVADLAGLLDIDPRALVDRSMGLLDDAMNDSAVQQARTGDIGGALEQQAESWAEDLAGGDGDGHDLSREGFEAWASELDPDTAPLDPEDYEGKNRIVRKRFRPTETQREANR